MGTVSHTLHVQLPRSRVPFQHGVVGRGSQLLHMLWRPLTPNAAATKLDPLVSTFYHDRTASKENPLKHPTT